LGVLVYLADEMVKREESKDYWTRTIRCIVPVTDVTRWQENTELLAHTLEVLSGDPVAVLTGFTLQHPGPSLAIAVACHSASTSSACSPAVRIHSWVCRATSTRRKEGRTRWPPIRRPYRCRPKGDGPRNWGRMFPGKTCLVQCRVSRSVRETPDFRLAPKVERGPTDPGRSSSSPSG